MNKKILILFAIVFMLIPYHKVEAKTLGDLKKEVIENYFLKADNIINEAIKKNDVVTNIPSEILGVNIYNAIYYNNHMVSTYFVMYGLKDDKKIEYGNFVIETKEYKKLTKIYRI